MIIHHLTEICIRNEFARVIVSDNGTLFVRKKMRKFCEEHDIQQVQSALCRPQYNGIIERLHSTLVPMVQKCASTRKEWDDMLPMALYFIRFTPSQSSVFSLYKVVHGWELDSRVSLLYKD